MAGQRKLPGIEVELSVRLLPGSQLHDKQQSNSSGLLSWLVMDDIRNAGMCYSAPALETSWYSSNAVLY